MVWVVLVIIVIVKFNFDYLIIIIIVISFISVNIVGYFKCRKGILLNNLIIFYFWVFFIKFVVFGVFVYIIFGYELILVEYYLNFVLKLVIIVNIEVM